MRGLKTILVCTLYSVLCIPIYASDIECVGTATQAVNGKDTTFIFKDEIHLKSNIGPIDWYTCEGALYASNAEEIYPDEDCYQAAGHRFRVELYKSLDALDVTVHPSCDRTELHVSGIAGTRARACSISYNALVWGDSNQWTDSAAVQTGTLMPIIDLPAIYGATPIRLCYDADIRAALGLDSACVEVDLPQEEVVALKMQLTHEATKKWDRNDKANELNKVDTSQLVVGSSYSGELDVLFNPNPTPTVRFYEWRVIKSSQVLATRQVETLHYTFSEPGTYEVVCKVYNDSCSSDSATTTVVISESYLAVPNVFTPNDDGKNDEFRVAYRSIKEFNIQVYNRWGKLVYQSNDPKKGWDGKINGRPAAEGAYFYVIRALGTDAPTNAKYMMKSVYNKKKKQSDESIIGIYQLSGDINLIR